ncbi:MAG: sugar-binding protein [Planctomycetota bacterium]|jgi:hypothetical protein
MNFDPEKLISLYFLDHTAMTESEAEQLSEWLKADVEHVRRFIRAALLHHEIHNRFLTGDPVKQGLFQDSVLNSDSGIFEDHMNDTGAWQALLDAERTAPGIEREVESPELKPSTDEKKHSENKRKSKFWPTVSIFSSAAALLMVILGIVEHVRSHRVVAELGNSVHAKWAETPDSNDLRPGTLELREGVAQIAFKQGTRVLIQAPCEFDLLSTNRMKLMSGSVTAFVPEQARGFRVMTPQSEIVDFGTEFGVAVASSTAYEVHVFKGRVGLEPDPKRPGKGKREDLLDGQCALADASGLIRTEALTERPKRFLQQMPNAHQIGIPGKRLNLADVIGGGNGFGTGLIGGSALRDLNLGTKVGWPINCVKLRTGQTISIDGVVTPGEYDGAQPVMINANAATGIDPYQPQYRHQMYGSPRFPNQWRDTSLDDFSATYYVMWDDDALYVAVSVRDDSYQSHESFELFDDASDTLHFTLSATPYDSHVPSLYGPSIAPRDKTTGRTIAKNHFGNRSGKFITNGLFNDPCHLPVYAGSVNDETQDWMVEVKIPWDSMIGAFAGDLANGDADGNGRNVFPPHLLDQIGFSIIALDSDNVDGRTQRQFHACTLNGAFPWEFKGNKTQETLTFIERPDSFGPVENLLYVDGIFTPGRAPNPCRISTQGHTFVAHPDSRASLPGAIMSGWPYEELPFADPPGGANGVPPARTACLSMWGSQGITFDLDRIREDLVGVQIDRFTARAGIANGQGTARIDANLWVLADGVVRFVQKGLQPTEMIDIEVSLDAGARFLTLVTTARDTTPMSSNENWYVFQDPVLELSRRP